MLQRSFPYLIVESFSGFLLINLLDGEPKMKDQRFICLNTGQLPYHIFKSSACRLNLLSEDFLFGALQWTLEQRAAVGVSDMFQN